MHCFSEIVKWLKGHSIFYHAQIIAPCVEDFCQMYARFVEVILRLLNWTTGSLIITFCEFWDLITFCGYRNKSSGIFHFGWWSILVAREKSKHAHGIHFAFLFQTTLIDSISRWDESGKGEFLLSGSTLVEVPTSAEEVHLLGLGTFQRPLKRTYIWANLGKWMEASTWKFVLSSVEQSGRSLKAIAEENGSLLHSNHRDHWSNWWLIESGDLHHHPRPAGPTWCAHKILTELVLCEL